MLHTIKSLAKTESRPELLVCIRGTIYDVSVFASEHPGGRKPLQALAGRDATEPFLNYHPARVHKLLARYRVGRVNDWKERQDEFAHDMRKLRALLVKKGLFDRTDSFYVKQAIWLLALFSASIYFTVFTSFFRIGALLLGLYFQQVAFLGHDLGHNSVTLNRSWDYYIANLFGNTTGGISIGFWKNSHNVHHVVPNCLEFDADNAHSPIFATSEEALSFHFSEFHQRDMPFTKLARFLISKQHMTFYPILLVARFNLYFQSILYLIKNKSEHRFLEISTLLIFWVWILGIGAVLPFWSYIQWMAISHFSSSILEVQICLSHFAETSYSGRPHNDSTDSWFRNQIRTTLDIDMPWYLDWFGGGLCQQTAHHCFPRLPRHNLREATEMLKSVCKKNDVKYNSLSFYDANKKLISHLREIAEKAKKSKTV